MNIPFFKPFITGKEIKYIGDILKSSGTLAGDGVYTKKVHNFLQQRYMVNKVLLTTSGTSGLEMASILLNLRPGDEVIVPSFTFSSTVNALLLNRGLKPVFAEIEPHTLNIDPEDIKRKITRRTKAIVVVHYAGVSCDMDTILEISKKGNIQIIEDAAQAIESKYKNKYLGTIGDFGILSFHETKNITCGEGGALFINKDDGPIFEKAEIIREKGTNRSKFYRGLVDKYTWVDIGSSYLPSDILAAFLYAQLEEIEMITKKRLHIYESFMRSFTAFENKGIVSLPKIPEYSTHNAHIFYILLNSKNLRDLVLSKLRSSGIQASFHYIPLHSSPQGQKLGYKDGDLPITENLSGRLLRLPVYSGMTEAELNRVIKVVTTTLLSL